MSASADSELKVLGRLMGHVMRVTALFESGTLLEFLSDSYLKRHALPEPFDVASHIGNFREGSIGTTAACGVIGMLACTDARLSGTQQEFRRRAKVTAMGAFLLSTAVQVVGEKYGLNNVVGGTNTPDMLDAAYGTFWSAVTAVVAYKYATGLDSDLRVARDARIAELNDSIPQGTDDSIGTSPALAHDFEPPMQG